MTLVLSTSHEVRPQVAVFTKQRDNTKRSQRLRCYRRRHEYSKTRGSRVSGRRSIAPRREWSDRHFMNRKPSLIDLARAASGRRSRRSRRCRRAAPPGRAGGSDVPAEHGGAQEVRSLPIGTSPPAASLRRTKRTDPHASIPVSTKVRAITDLRINYSRRYLKIFVCDAKRSEAAGRADAESHTRTASPPRGD